MSVARILPRRADEREFLPAALEIVETPASPTGRAILWTIVAAFTVALAWASWGTVDVISTASGKIVPTGRTKLVQPFETGVVRAIHVRDGQRVAAGEVLVELDSTINGAERDRLAKERIAMLLDVARLTAALEAASPEAQADPAASFVPPEGATRAQVSRQLALLGAQVDEYRAKLANLERQTVQNEANRAAVAATVEKLTQAIPLLKQRVAARKYLSDKEVGSKLQYLEVQQDLVEHEHDLMTQRARLEEAAAALSTLREQRRQVTAEYRRTVLADLAQAEQKAVSLGEELVKAQQHHDLQTLAAPVAGTVQQLAVHTVGGVVTPAQPLLVIVPADSRLEVEAMVQNRDIGFIREGQEVEVKIDTFNFTKYGLVHGRVVSVSRDAITRERQMSDREKQATSASSENSQPAGQDLLYAARIAIDATEMQVDGRAVDLAPGMAVTAEIKTGERRIIEYLLSPVLRHRQESLRER